MAELNSTTRWVIRRTDNGEFFCWSNTWGTDIREAQLWVDEGLAKKLAGSLAGDARAVKARLSTVLELEDDAGHGKPERAPVPAEADGGRVREPRINGLTIPDYVRTMERAHEATKNSQLLFK